MNADATLNKTSPQTTSPPRFLMCPPRHFAVTYSINPWMDPKAWAAGSAALLHEQAATQWAGLHRALAAAGAAVETLAAEPGLPDLVFTANGAVVLDRKAVLARFRHGERKREEPVFASEFTALKARGLIDEIVELPRGVILEGAGDCIWDSHRGVFWMGCGFRSDAAAAPFLERQFGVRCLPLRLADPRFYHLDTAFCALPGGAVIYYPEAFTPPARAVIGEHVPAEQCIALSEADASHFAANAVCAGRTIILSSCSEVLRETLAERGYAVIEAPLDVFQKSGGSACCLTLRLDHRSRTIAAAATAPEKGDVVPERAVRRA